MSATHWHRHAPGLGLMVVLLATGTVVEVAGRDATPAPTISASRVISASRTKDGVRVSARTEGPWVAGEPARVRVRVTNVGSEPIQWYAVREGVSVIAEMTDATWRTGEPVKPLPGSGEPGFPVRSGLKDTVVRAIEPNLERILLDFRLQSIDGVDVDSGDALAGPVLEPGRSRVYVQQWDGFARLDQGMVGDVGLPPSGPVRLRVAAHYADIDGIGRTTGVAMETVVVGGWDDPARPHALEIVDLALQNPAFAALMEEVAFDRSDDVILRYDHGTERWYVGSCGLREDDDRWDWTLAAVDPVDGEVLELIEGHGDETCDAGTPPGSAAVASRETLPQRSMADRRPITHRGGPNLPTIRDDQPLTVTITTPNV